MELRVNDLNMEGLYTITEYTDNIAGNILLFTPIVFSENQSNDSNLPENNWPAIDTSRPPIYIGKTMLQTNRGPLEIRFPLEAKTLREAFYLFGSACKQRIDEIQSQITRNSLVQGIGQGPNGNILDLSKLKTQ